jgi:hypothetical protein
MSAYRSLKFKIIGVSPLLVHNGQLADPLNPHAKAMAQISAKRKKTEADQRQLADLEFLGSLYISKGMPCLPAEMMEAALVRAAGHERRSAKAKAGIMIREDLLLQYDGPKDAQALRADPRFRLRCAVRIGPSRIMRTRPRFSDWAADVTVNYLPKILNEQDIRNFLEVVGSEIGVGDWRPKFGRFHVEDILKTDTKK